MPGVRHVRSGVRHVKSGVRHVRSLVFECEEGKVDTLNTAYTATTSRQRKEALGYLP